MRFSCWSFCFDCCQLPRRNDPWAEICVWFCGLLPWNDLDNEALQIFTACNLVAPYNGTSPLQGFQCFSATAWTVDLKSCRFVFLWGDSKLSKVWQMQKKHRWLLLGSCSMFRNCFVIFLNLKSWCPACMFICWCPGLPPPIRSSASHFELSEWCQPLIRHWGYIRDCAAFRSSWNDSETTP
jgi:hypothetical protein